jgi:hypothetical protein
MRPQVGVAAGATSAGSCDIGVFERGEHVADDDLLDVAGLHRVGAATVAVRLVTRERPTRRALPGLQFLVHALADGSHHRSAIGTPAHACEEFDLRSATDGRVCEAGTHLVPRRTVEDRLPVRLADHLSPRLP